MELKTWTLHIACSHYEGLVEVASLLEKAFTIKGANSDFFLRKPFHFKPLEMDRNHPLVPAHEISPGAKSEESGPDRQ